MEKDNTLINKDNQTNSTAPLIFTPGINQLYFVDFKFLTYIDLEKEITSIIQQKNNSINFSQELSKLLENFDNNLIVNYSDFKKNLFDKININFNALFEYLDKWIKKNVNYLHKNQLSFIKSINGNIYNENPFHLLIDELCLTKYQKDNNISFNFYTQKELLSNDLLKNLIIKDNKIFLYSYDPSILVKFRKNLDDKNLFTFLLNIYLFCFKDLVHNSEEEKIVNKIKNYFKIEKEKNNIHNKSQYVINSDVNLLSNNIFSYNYLYYEIINKKISSYDSLIKYFDEEQPKIVLVFTRFLTRKQNFVKQRYFISDKDVIFKPHYGGVDLICNGKIDMVLAKSYELKDFEEYKDIFNFLENNYRMANDICNFKYFVDKNLQDKFLNNFCNIINNNDILNNGLQESNEEKYKLYTINSISVNLKQFIDKNYLINILKKNNINFPLILKYTSDNPIFKHQASIILNENYLDNFINNYINKIYDEKYNTTMLIQHITHHGGYVLKVYHLGNKNFIDYRSSLINIDETNTKMVEELFEGNGYWNFKTIMLESDEYKNNIWGKYVEKNGVENKIKKNKKLFDYIMNVVSLFEIYSHMGLFGVDILIDNENKLYIIDANSLPGYKKGFDIEKDLRNYFKKIIP